MKVYSRWYLKYLSKKILTFLIVNFSSDNEDGIKILAPLMYNVIVLRRHSTCVFNFKSTQKLFSRFVYHKSFDSENMAMIFISINLHRFMLKSIGASRARIFENQ